MPTPHAPAPHPHRTGNDNPGPACRDAIVALDATPESPYFGSIVSVAFTPTWGNEPHHVSGMTMRTRPGGAGHREDDGKE